MVEKLLEVDQNLFLKLNHWASPGFDPVMLLLSGWIPWMILLIIFFFFIGYHFRPILSLRNLIILISVAAVWILTDQLSVHLFKELFERLRPCHEPTLSGQVRLVVASCGGEYGFVSSHAANSFGLATLTSLFIRNRWYTLGALLWALLISYSRIYVGVHYPGDVLCGMMLGGVTALIIHFAGRYIQRTPDRGPGGRGKRNKQRTPELSPGGSGKSNKQGTPDQSPGLRNKQTSNY